MPLESGFWACIMEVKRFIFPADDELGDDYSPSQDLSFPDGISINSHTIGPYIYGKGIATGHPVYQPANTIYPSRYKTGKL